MRTLRWLVVCPLVALVLVLGSAVRAHAQTPEQVTSPHAVDPRVCIPLLPPRGPQAGLPTTRAAVDSAFDRFIRTDTVADLQRALQQLVDLYAHAPRASRGQPDSLRVATTFRALHLADSVQAALHAVGVPSTHVFLERPATVDAQARYAETVAENQRRADASACAVGVRRLEELVLPSLVEWIGDAYRNDLRAQSQLVAEARAGGISSATFAQINRLSFGALALALDDPRPPTFELVIRAAPHGPGVFNFGDTVRMPLEGRLLAGGPVAGGVVRWSVAYQHNNSYPRLDGFRLGWAQDTATIPPAEGTLSLDDSGRAVLVIPRNAGWAHPFRATLSCIRRL